MISIGQVPHLTLNNITMAFTPLKQFKTTLDTMLEYVSRLWFLAEVRGNVNDIRVTPTGTVTVAWSVTATVASGTITTLSNQTAIWGYQANTQIQNMMNIEATLANIDNLIIN